MTHGLGWNPALEQQHTAEMSVAMTAMAAYAGEELPENLEPDLTINDQGPFGSCFPPGTLVRMADGSERPIELIRATESVVSASGRPQVVLQSMARRHDGNLVNLLLWGHNAFYSTEDHPLLTRRGWIAASDIRVGDWIAMPAYLPKPAAFIQTAQWIEPHLRKYVVGRRQSRSVVGRKAMSAIATAVPDIIELNADFGRIIGLFLAEGNTDSSRVVWSFHIDEMDTLIADLCGLLKKLGAEPNIQVRIANKCAKVVVYGTNWARLFEGLCNTGSGAKMLCGELSQGSVEFLGAALRGWFDGDGHFRRKTQQGTTVSKMLAQQMFDIANALGHRPCLNSRPAVQNHHARFRRDPWEVSLTSESNNYRVEADNNGVMWRSVRGMILTPYRGYVHNLHVENDESYIASGIAVHNCTGQAVDKSLECDHLIEHGTAANLSPRWSYLAARLVDGNPTGPDAGASISGAALAAKQYGTLLESDFPYWTTNVFDYSIPDAVRAKAARFKVRSVCQLRSYDEWLQFIGTGQGGSIIGVAWLTGLRDYDGSGPLNKATGRSLGGHAIAPLGWRMLGGERCPVIWNSHSKRYGDGGKLIVTPRLFDEWLRTNGYGANGISGQPAFTKRKRDLFRDMG